MRFLTEYKSDSGKKARVYRDTEWDEYCVKFYDHKGTYLDAADYHTSDKEDAFATAEHAINEENRA